MVSDSAPEVPKASEPFPRPRRARTQHPFLSIGAIPGFKLDDITRLQTERLAGLEWKRRLTFGGEGHRWHGATMRASPYVSTEG
jgi:hypothetical protein